MNEIKSCGLVANPNDDIERITLIAIRYMAWIGEALSMQLTFGHNPQSPRNPYTVFTAYFDRIEHIIQDALEDNFDVSKRAGFLMDNITIMKLTLDENSDALDKFCHANLPTISDLKALYSACQNLGGNHLAQDPAF